MELNYRKSESLQEPAEIDKTSSEDGVYVRRDVRLVEKENEDGSVLKKYEYEEAFLTFDEYEVYSRKRIVADINGENASAAYENYKRKLNTPVVYPTNGLTYLPIYYEVYEEYINKIGGVLTAAEKFGKDITPILAQTYAVFDATEKAENMRLMTGGEVIDLYFFLLGLKEAYFAEYKAEKIGE